MKRREYIASVILIGLCSVYLAWVWFRLFEILVEPGRFMVEIPQRIALLTMVLVIAASTTAITRTIAFSVPSVLIAFAGITFMSFEPMSFSTSLSWNGYTCGWPMPWLALTVRNHTAADACRTLEYTISAGRMGLDLAVAAIPVILLVLSRFQNRKANHAIQRISDPRHASCEAGVAPESEIR
jgi:hypothetical protein